MSERVKDWFTPGVDRVVGEGIPGVTRVTRGRTGGKEDTTVPETGGEERREDEDRKDGRDQGRSRPPGAGGGKSRSRPRTEGECCDINIDVCRPWKYKWKKE